MLKRLVVMPLPPAMFSALAMTRSTLPLAHQARQFLVENLPPGPADHIAKAENAQRHAGSIVGRIHLKRKRQRPLLVGWHAHGRRC